MQRPDQIDTSTYDQQLAEKVERMQQLFAEFNLPEVEVFASPPSHYRMRAEFRVWHQDGRAHYAMFAPGENNRPILLQQFPVGSTTINRLMPLLMDHINATPDLQRRLFHIEFLTSQTGDALVTLAYHRPIDDAWEQLATTMSEQFGIPLIGRSRKQKRIIGRDYILESFQAGDRQLSYQQVEGGFTQPNAAINQQMINWLRNKIGTHSSDSRDLLELYCGNGNFTLALSDLFPQVLATELAKSSVNSAHFNLRQNHIDNVKIARLSSEEFTQAMQGVREFRRLKEQQIHLQDYQIGTVLVDPPRAGLDPGTTSLVSQFEQILYISCNPETLANNLRSLCQTHDVEHFALFDQFPYTHHVETGVVLRKR